MSASKAGILYYILMINKYSSYERYNHIFYEEYLQRQYKFDLVDCLPLFFLFFSVVEGFERCQSRGLVE